MSRIGKIPVPIPSGVQISVQDHLLTIEGKQGRLTFEHRPEVTVTVDKDANEVVVGRETDDRQSRALHGTTRSLIANMIEGVTDGFKKELEITGVGWSAQVSGQQVNLNVGFADTKTVPIPMGVEVNIDGMNITVTGPDKQKVGQLAAQIRQVRPPEPYNGKGIKYADEQIIRKEGKAFAGSGA